MKALGVRELDKAQGSRVFPSREKINTSNSDTEKDEWYDAVEELQEQDKLKDDQKTSQQTIIYSKIADLSERIEDIEKTVITLVQDNTKGKEIIIDKESDISKEIEEILQDWTVKIQNRYKSVGALPIEEAQSVILEVIKAQVKDHNKTELIQAVNQVLKDKIQTIESQDQKTDILKKALEHFKKEPELVNAEDEINKEAITEIETIIKDIKTLDSLTDSQKFQLLTRYKTIEFFKLQSANYNMVEETRGDSKLKNIDEVAQELKKLVGEDNRNIEITKLKEQYIQLCVAKIEEVFRKLSVLKNKFETISSFLNTLILSIVEGLEKFSPNDYDRHHVYDKILIQLDSLLYPVEKYEGSESEKIEHVKSTLQKIIKQEVLLTQWQKNFSNQKMTLAGISNVLEDYFTTDKENNVEELEYYIDYIVEDNKVGSQEIYEIINNLNNKANLNLSEHNRDHIKLLKRFILSKADQIEFEKIKRLFQDRLNYQEEQYKEVLAIKDSIIKDFSKYCGMLDKSNKENYTIIVKLYLDKLDRLIAERNKEDISYVARKQIFESLRQSVTDIIEDKEVKDNSKSEHIEEKISVQLSNLVFDSNIASDLPIDIVAHLSKFKDSSLGQSHYKRGAKIGQIIKLEDIFDNNGRVKEKEGKEVFIKNNTVIVNIDQEEYYYRLSEDINALACNQTAYEKAIEEYRNELSIQYRRYKLVELTKAIEDYNSSKNIKNLLNLTKHLIYYLTLQEEHLECNQTFENLIQQFLEIYHNTIEYLMINDKCDQDIISELRIAIDLFTEDVIQQRIFSNKEKNTTETEELAKKLVLNLKSLRNRLIYKTYKESGFKLFTEEENQFKQQLARNNLLKEKLNELVQEKIPEIIWLRGFVTAESSELFFKSFNEQITELLPERLSNTDNDNIDKVQRFIYQERNKIVLIGLIDDNSLQDIEDFITRIVNKELLWEKILLNSKIADHHKFQKLSFIIQEHHSKFSQESFKALIIELDKKEQSIDLDYFIEGILRLYINKMLADTKISLKAAYPNKESIVERLSISIYLEEIISDAFNVLQIVKNTPITKSYEEFISHLNQLINCISNTQFSEDSTKTIEDDLVDKQIRFITDIFGISESEQAPKINNIIFNKLIQSENPEKIIYLKLLLQLPDSFYNNQENYKNFIQELIKLDVSESSELSNYIRENIYRYYDLFLDNILGINTDIEDLEQRKSDIQEVLIRLYNNIPAADFIKYSGDWLKQEVIPDNKTNTNKIAHSESVFHIITNSFFQSNGFDLAPVLQFLYSEEKEHLKALLDLDSKIRQSDGHEEKKSSQELDEEIKLLWTKCSKQPSKSLVIGKIKELFTNGDSSPIMWTEELIDLRLNLVREIILSDERLAQDHGMTKISDILDVFRFFHEEKGNLNIALDLLGLICIHLKKFTTLEEIKQSIYSLVQVEDLTIATNIIKCNDTKSITLDLLFSQIDAGDNKKLKNSIDKLKLILSNKAFDEINDFCKIFILQIREQQNLDSLPNIIDLIITSKAHIRQDFLKSLQDKNISLWSIFLEKAIILNELNTTNFNRCSNKEKGKAVDLLYQIKEEKGENLQQTLLGKIKKLDKDTKDSCNIKKLNLILNKIIHKQCKSEAIENLSSKLNEWEESLFLNSDSGSAKVLTVKQLLISMKEGERISDDGINSSIKHYLQGVIEEDETLIERLLKNARTLNKKSKIYTQCEKNIDQWQEQDIKVWAKSFKSYAKRSELFWRTAESTETISEVISVIIRAVTLYDHHPNGPRDTQLISLLLFLDSNKKGRLGNVSTGEGKTLITVMLATCLGLIGKKVDIVTSSKILAVRDSKTREPKTKEGYKGYFEMFDLKASNNCDEECEKATTGEEERKSRYESCNIIYGETGYFQRDILLSQFFSKDIRDGSGIGDVLILDEVDSMMIDNAAKTLYISHNIIDMRHLRDVFIHIWAAVNTREERYYSEENVEKIIKYINKIIGNVESENSTSEQEGFKLSIPSTLYDFVQMNLKIWIESAYDAKHIGEDDAYIIGDEASQRQNEIIIMDKDTGVEQTSTKWSNGLHQFIQLKHSGKLSDESLKAVYISNIGYLQRYDNLYGMTGTVGKEDERGLLSRVYGIDFFEMPRFKTYRFEYDFESESVAGTSEEWLHNIMANIDENMDQQLPYTAEYIASMEKKYEEEDKSLKQFEKDLAGYNKEKQKLELQQKQFQERIKIFEALEKATDKIIEICKKPVLDKFKTDIKRISNEITTLKGYCTNSDSGKKVDELLHLITKISDSDSEYVIDQSGTEFNNNIKKLAIADLNNQAKEELKKLDTEANKIQEEIDYIEATKVTSKQYLEFYKIESQTKVGNQRENSRRAVLIICDNISDLKTIADRARETFNSDKYNIYTYDRAYRSFDVSCLEAGDIVIATNIAGRGTDLEVSKLVEENGGLHVILSYMPKNLRIEQQAFGRTARGGNKGTATYIVFDPRKQSEDIDISYLKQERSEIESKRLVVLQKEQLPKITLEDELFVKFNELRQNVENILKNKFPQNILKNPLKLQIESLKNKWAIWLNKISDKLNKVHETESGEILKEYEVFKKEIIGKLDNKYGLIEEPGELNALGRSYLDNGQYAEASNCFDYIIENHSLFASIALYYKAFCIIYIEGGGFDAKVKAKATLKKSLAMLEDDRSRILSRNQILKSINEITRSKGKGLQSNCFAKQNEGEAQVLSVHINAINSAIGSEISPDCFNSPGIVGDQPQKLFDELLKDQYGVIKDFRISKKCIIANKVLVKTHEEQRSILQQKKLILIQCLEEYKKLPKLSEEYVLQIPPVKLESYDNALNFITACKGDYITYKDKEYEPYKKILRILESTKIISERQIFKQISNLDDGITDSQITTFPDVFSYCKEQVLDSLMHSLINSQQQSWNYKERKLQSSSFEPYIYTKKKFLEDTESLIKVEEVIRIAPDIVQKLLGQLDHPVFCNKGDLIKNILTNDKLVGIDNHRIIAKHKLVQVIKDETSLEEEQINHILAHLEVYEKLSIDHAFLEKRFKDVKNKAIFFGKKAEIQEFCLGRRTISLSSDKVITLLDSQSFAKDEIVEALKKIVQMSASTSFADKTSFDALLIQLGFDVGVKFEAINSYNQYILKDATHIGKIKEYLEIINLKNSSKNEDTIGKIEQLDFSVDSRLIKKSDKITEVLKTNLHVDKPLKKEDFLLEEEEFGILRAILTDANIITTSIFNRLMERKDQENINLELETILMGMYKAGGVISDRDIVLKDAKEGSQELFNRMRELRIIKPPKVNFKLGRAKYVPEFLGGNVWKDSSDPAKRIEYIKSKIEKVVQEVFGLERQNDALHEANEYLTGGIGTESKNKELDERIETITNIIKHVAGTIKTLPEIKFESKDLRTMFSEGKVPPELMDYIHICFDAVLEYKEDKGFDWDCFLCTIIGLAQIVAGVALEILSGGSAHFIAQALIAEGIGDIVFAIQAGIEGNFSWKSYGQHKVQSLMISLVTGGVGKFLSKGAQGGKLAVGLATKTSITKATMKTVVVEACTAVVTATVNIGAEEISKLLIEEIANTHFIQYFEKWTREDNAYHQKTMYIENKLNELYNKFGTAIAKQSIETFIESSLNQMLSGTLGDKIFAQISRVVGGITKVLSLEANRFGKGNSKAKLLGAFASCVEKTVKVAEFSKNFAQLCNICNDFYDHLGAELIRIEESLIEQQKNGTLKINYEQIAQDKVNCSFSGEASRDLRNAQEKMHNAFKAKIKNGFLQPAVSSLLHMAVKPIQQMITAPFANAMDQLKDHIESRAEMFQTAIMNQHADRVVPITARQKKALEARGDIIKLEEIKDPSFLKAEVTNFGGETLEKLQREHGSNIHVMIKDGKIYTVLPTYKQFCSNIQSSNLKLAGELHVKMAATQAGRNIEVVSADIDGSKTLIHHEKGPGTVEPISGSKPGKESYKIAFIEGENGKSGHYAPVIKDKDGNWKVVRDIVQTSNTQDACFAQTMVYLKEHEKSDHLTAKTHAEVPEKITQYNKSLGKFAKHNKAVKSYYLQGTTVKNDRIVGGTPPHIKKPLKKQHYPSHENRIVAQEILKIILADFRNALSKAQAEAENFDIHKISTNRLKSMGNIIPVFGSNPDKTEMMMGVLSVNFTDGTTFKIITVSGDSKFFTRQKFVISNNDYTQGTFEEQNFNYRPQHCKYKDFKFVDSGKPSGKIYDVYNHVELTQEYSRSCAAQKLLYELAKYMKVNPKLKIKGEINMSESWYKKANRFVASQIILEDSCKECKKVLPLVTGSSGLQGINLSQYTNIGSINAYFGEYTINAIKRILQLRINKAGLEDVTITRGYVLQENYNNLQKIISDLTDLKSEIILAPLNLYNKHAAGIMGVKDSVNNLRIYYIDSSNKNIPVRLKQIFVDNSLHIERLPSEQQKYGNCGPEVIENFMLYLTGERLSQEDAIVYNSRLVEQELMANSGNSGTERFSKTVHGSYFMHIFARHRQYVSECEFVPEVRDTQSNRNQIIELHQEEEAKLIGSATATEESIVILPSKQERIVSSDEVVTTDHRNDDDKLYLRTTEYLYATDEVINDKTELVDEIRPRQDIKLMSNPIKQVIEIVVPQQERTASSSEAVTINRNNGNKLYLRATEMAEKGWLAESSEDDNAVLIAESRFAEAKQLYAKAMSLNPANIMYRQAFNVISLKIDGNSLFNQGVALADIAYQLGEDLLSEEKRYILDYNIIISKYLDVINIYQSAHDKFTEGLRLSLDMRFKSCVELVKQSINNIQMAVGQLEDEKQGIEILVDDVVENSEDEPFIELFANNNEHGLMEGVLMGINHPVDYHLIM
jgi:preprotein translocase subunit SecA